MAETNSDKAVVDDDKEVTEEDLRALKYGKDGVEDSNESDETDDTEETEEDSEEAGDDDGQTDDATNDDESEDDSSDDSTDDTSDFVKEFPNIKGDTPEEYAKNLEAAYKNSTAEFQRLRSEKATDDDSDDSDTTATVDTSDPISLYMKQKMDDEIQTAFADFGKEYTQVNDQSEYNKFTVEVATLSQTILQSQKRLASPTELYKKAAVILGWEPQSKPSSKEKMGMALKDKAASTKSSSSSGKAASKSKVTDAMIKVNRMMYPGKSDDDIRKELEPYV